MAVVSTSLPLQWKLSFGHFLSIGFFSLSIPVLADKCSLVNERNIFS